jgi:gamma-glutamylcyclotransferase (GGCT)/AIG2-like uncharacterized protein YtfP
MDDLQLQLRYDKLTRDIDDHTDDIEYLEQVLRNIRHIRTEIYENSIDMNNQDQINMQLSQAEPMFTIKTMIDSYYTRYPMIVTYKTINYRINEYPSRGDVVRITKIGIFTTIHGYIYNANSNIMELKLKANPTSQFITEVEFQTSNGLQKWLYISDKRPDGTIVLKYGYNQQIILNIFNKQSNIIYLRLNVPRSGSRGNNIVLFLLKPVPFNTKTSHILDEFPPLEPKYRISSEEIFRTLNNLENEPIIGIDERTNSPSTSRPATHTASPTTSQTIPNMASRQRKVYKDAVIKKIMDLTRDIKADDGNTWLVPKGGIPEDLNVRSAEVSDAVYYTRGKLISRSGKLFAHWDSDIIERGAILTVTYAKRYSRTTVVRYYFQGLDIKSDYIVADLTEYTDFFELSNAFESSFPGTVFLNISENKAVLAIPEVGSAKPFESNKWRTDDILQSNHPSLGRLTKIPIEHLK